MKLLTCGYEGLKAEDFFGMLQANRVEKIVDLRELPLSRKPGFSKIALSRSAERRGLRYMHIRELGSPRKIRHDYREDDNWDRFQKRYGAYLDSQTEAIQQLAEVVSNERCCLLCFESDPNFCHRSLVTDRVMNLLGNSVVVEHLRAHRSD